ncbi:hypothetical protein NQ315_011506 [Exocentrus adspersus]|uniref:Uncharacterized protein n=1 Tax=Exocentrus adspersus TaxID=1586481 RepID=A0AAV8VVW3_9CUCU|nr:hypothetical protein NQ315_011506 [Exocentrus adspersus]
MSDAAFKNITLGKAIKPLFSELFLVCFANFKKNFQLAHVMKRPLSTIVLPQKIVRSIKMELSR